MRTSHTGQDIDGVHVVVYQRQDHLSWPPEQYLM